ncbi:H-NS histone family protein [Paraburkholderia rhynchosiae]|uniref:DNA-binding protein H-NS-like C-terminal domain-containing protein n=1 Tax=Paraburkholderia rhynchosiae TaxID=487049 RepID=A0ABX4VFF8_9BURK|nr:H-NS histone family protein [Paraburkholderia rhynchosiae]PMS33768.1 hypothetical protein C0Z16_04355 [Paraburkholderia rhynchosiae]
MATLKEIQARIRKLAEKADAVIKKQEESQKAIRNIKEMMRAYGISVDDLHRQGRGDSGRGRSIGKESPAARYRDPISGTEWSGRGRPPKWIAEASDRTPFLVEEPSSSGASSRTRATRKKAKKTPPVVEARKIPPKKTPVPRKPDPAPPGRNPSNKPKQDMPRS